MNLSTIDWIIAISIFAMLIAVAWYTTRYTRSVAAFLAADRSAGRYLLSISSGMADLGAISIIANFEKFYQAGFSAAWWGTILGPVALVLTVSGFVIYRFRETRALTLAEFFERRYSRRFRIFAGILAFGSGIINYGIFPGVTARFLIYFMGLPTEFSLLGFDVPTLVPVMLIMLSAALMLTLAGGQITVMVTDFLQGQLVNIVMLAIMILLLVTIGFDTIVEGLQMAPPGESKLNPLDQANIPDFNVWFFVMMALLNVYGTMAWQGSSGYNASATNAHEAKMARMLGGFRGMVTSFVIMLLPIAAYALMQHPSFTGLADTVNQELATIGDDQTRKQMTVPIVVSHILPAGMMGLFATVILAASLTTDDTYLHSWGSIFIQDVLMPFRKRRLEPAAHLRLLRLAMVGVAAFAFIFSLLFPLQAYIFMFFQITGAIYLGGAGAVIIGGLYWSRGTTAGAWAAMLTGSTLAVGGIVLQNIIWPRISNGIAFPFNGMEMSFGAAIIAMSVYVLVSLATCRKPANMDALLHRGAYAVEGDHAESHARPVTGLRSLGITSEYTRGDKVIYILNLSLFFVVFIPFVIGTIWGLVWGLPEWAWIKYWWFKLMFTLIVGTAATIWFIIGGFGDMKRLFRTLATARSTVSDDGFVSDQDKALTQGNTADCSTAESDAASTEVQAARV